MGAVSPIQGALYTIMVTFGILGNCLVIGVVGESVLRDSGRGSSSDLILVNMALSNLLVSLVRNIPLMLADSGLQVRRPSDSQSQRAKERFPKSSCPSC